MAKNARKLELGPANVYLHVLPHASLLTGYPDVDAEIYFESVRAGNGFDVSGNPVDYAGNDVTITIVEDAGLNPPSVTVVGTAITIHVDGLADTADDVIAAIQASPEAAFLVTAARGVGSDGTGFPQATGPTNLAGGDGPEEIIDVGYLGDEVAYQVTTEAANLTGAQAGNTPLDKVVIGGMVRVVIPFKEISLDNFRRGVPSARVTKNADGSKSRVDFVVAVGQSMRQTLTQKITIKKIKGGFESPLPADHIVIPEISPAEGEVNFPFAPTTQRVIMTNWYAWPNDATGRWAFMGDENP